LPGREFSVAILKDIDTGVYDAMPLELVAPADTFGERFLSAQVKSADTERNLPVTDPIIRTQISLLALNVFEALGARDYGRIDIRLDAQGVPHFLEANLLPSLLEGYGNFPKACLLNKGLPFTAMINNLVELAWARETMFDDDLQTDAPVTWLRTDWQFAEA
jgi:D-alanine-D-alanine ligase